MDSLEAPPERSGDRSQNRSNTQAPSLPKCQREAPQEKKIPTDYFVDFDSVAQTQVQALFNGAELLSNEDKVYVIYTPDVVQGLIPFQTALNLENSLADFCCYETPALKVAGSANKHLIAILAADVGRHGSSRRYVVVSEKQDYAPIVKLVREICGLTKKSVVLQGCLVRDAEASKTNAPDTNSSTRLRKFMMKPSLPTVKQDFGDDEIERYVRVVQTGITDEELTEEERSNIVHEFLECVKKQENGVDGSSEPLKSLMNIAFHKSFNDNKRSALLFSKYFN